MMNEKTAILVILSRLLDYPDDLFLKNRSTITLFVNESISSKKNRKEVLKRIDSFFEMPLERLKQLYVETFDHNEKTNLYLTAHEFGDSRRRGVALIQLQRMIASAGFEVGRNELADYIPMLLEFLSVVPENRDSELLSRRVAYAVDRILKHLSCENPFKNALELLMMFVFEAPKAEEVSALEILREEADLEELPYPLMYR